MAQDNALYAVARIRCHENGLIGRERMARMIAGTAEESDAGAYGRGLCGAAAGEAPRMWKRSSRPSLRVPMRSCGVSPEPCADGAFPDAADVHNLKALYKLPFWAAAMPGPLLMQGVRSIRLRCAHGARGGL